MSDVDVGKEVLRKEAAALLHLEENLGSAFQSAVDWLIGCRGRVITCGIGKSGQIAKKCAGTLSSTGTPSLFLHAAEAVHGDLGAIAPGDVVIVYTHSGETDELVRLFPAIRELGAKTITITGRGESSAARLSDLTLETLVQSEACAMNLAPTTSTTAMLALSDALAIAVMRRRGFTSDDFGRLHPRGALGRRLTLRVSDVMRRPEEIGAIGPESKAVEVIEQMTAHAIGAICVIEEDRFVGLVSEGDLRRHLLHSDDPLHVPARMIMNTKPMTIQPELLAIEAIEIFQNYPVKIGELPVVVDKRVVGLLVLKDLVRSGII